MNTEERNNGNLLSGQEPHQKEVLDQAERASQSSCTLEPEKGITGDEDGPAVESNIKQASVNGADPALKFGPVGKVNLDEDSYVTDDDLQTLDGRD